MMAFKIPLSNSDSPRSHSADASIIDMLAVSMLDAQEAGIIARMSRYWNFPVPATAIAVSKSAIFIDASSSITTEARDKRDE